MMEDVSLGARVLLAKHKVRVRVRVRVRIRVRVS